MVELWEAVWAGAVMHIKELQELAPGGMDTAICNALKAEETAAEAQVVASNKHS